MSDLEVRKRVRDESAEAELDIISPEVKKLRENLLETLEDDEVEFCAATQDLDSFMKSFEEEIAASPSAAFGGVVVPAADLPLGGAGSRLDLGYLLEASDDELGLPPTASELRNDLERVESDSSELGSEFWEIADYDSFGFGFGVMESGYDGVNGEYTALNGLFDYSDMGFGSSGGVGPRPETLPA